MGFLGNINNPSDIKKLNSNNLSELAEEIREFLIYSVSKTGGHLASNLGVVELTIALHRVFSTPTDKIIWDVGHQSYVHKILTGRCKDFDKLRKYGGISGFPRCAESEHDAFDAGHSSTSISAALGFARARDLNKQNNSVIAVIGDGSLSGGLAYEGLNNAGRIKTNFIVILNDNEMSISKNVGGMSKYLNKLRTAPLYFRAKKDIDILLNKIPKYGATISHTLEKTKNSIRSLIMQGSIFEELGFTYLGPIDGHDISQMIDVFKRAKTIKGPVLLHIYTKKGKGYSYAEDEPDKFHGIGKFNIDTGVQNGKITEYVSTSKVFGDTLIDIAKNNKNVVAVTAAMPDGTGLKEYSKMYKNRFFDVGIAEQHAVTFAGGLSKCGIVPVVAIYSTFLQRAYDQIFHDIALQNLHVVFAIDRAGLVGEDGETHHGIYDLSYLTHIPNIAVLAPSSPNMLSEMLDYAINKHAGPIAIRYPKVILDTHSEISFEFGKANVATQGSKITLVAVGNMLEIARLAAKISGESVEVIDIRTVKPLDSETIIKSANKTGKVIVLEDNVKIGGAGSLIESIVNVPVIKLGYKDEPVTHGSLSILYELNGVDAEAVSQVIKRECSC